MIIIILTYKRILQQQINMTLNKRKKVICEILIRHKMQTYCYSRNGPHSTEDVLDISTCKHNLYMWCILPDIIHIFTFSLHRYTTTLPKLNPYELLILVERCKNMRSGLEYPGSDLHSNVRVNIITISRSNITVSKRNNQSTFRKRV